MLEPLDIQIKDIRFRMMPVEGGEFWMGLDIGHPNATRTEHPRHKVQVADFYLAQFPVTQALWREVVEADGQSGLNPDPSDFKGPDLPVDSISWEEIVERFLPAIKRLTGFSFRLPSEAQWEYAARGGKYWQEDYRYSGTDRLLESAWYPENSEYMTRPVGLLLPNALEIYDLIGNVLEWCADDWHESYDGAPVVSEAWVDFPERGDRRVLRGGSFISVTSNCLPSFRFGDALDFRDVDYGFRLALPLQSVG